MANTTALPPNVGGVLVAPGPSTPAARKRWLAARRAGLGASEVSTILGLAPPSWGTTPLGVWLDKTHPEQVQDDPTERMLWGLRLERPIADEYRIRHATPNGIRVDPCPGLLAHPEHRWLLATPDRLLTRPATYADWEIHPEWFVDQTYESAARVAVGVLEIKTADAMLQREWDLGVPLHYQVQVQVQMGITGLPWADVVPLFGGNHMPHPYRVEFDPLAFAQIVELCGAWWAAHVEADVPPEPTIEDIPLLSQVWPGDDDAPPAHLSSALLERVLVRERIKERIKQLEAAAARVEVDLKTTMRNAKVAMYGDQKVATWTRYDRNQFRQKDFAADHPALAAQYTDKIPSQRLTVHRLTTEGE